MGETVGFIGLGRMGGPMAGRLIAAGHSLVVHDIRREAVEALVALGAKSAESPAAVASAVRTVLVSLPTPEIVREVALGARGIAEGNAVTTYVDLSTVGYRAAKANAEALGARGIIAIDAPVSGGVAGAERGSLSVMAAGPQARVEALEPLLRVFGKVFYLGAQPGLGQTMKLANNLLSGAALAITSEAMVMGVKAGLDPRVMLEVLNVSTGRNSATQDKFPRAVLPRRFDAGFASGLMLKDITLCLEEAEALGVPMGLAESVRKVWQATCERNGADSDFTTVVQGVEERAGVTVAERRGGP